MPKGRESGMPDEVLWRTFFDPEEMLDRLGCQGRIDVFEFGCGYGTFTIPVARRIAGKLLAIDIDPAMAEGTQRFADNLGLSNVQCRCLDFYSLVDEIDSSSFDYAMAFNILHIESPVVLLREAHRLLRPNGVLAICHWKKEPTPRGPSMEIRPTMEDCRGWCLQAGFCQTEPRTLTNNRWHWGMVARKA